MYFDSSNNYIAFVLKFKSDGLNFGILRSSTGSMYLSFRLVSTNNGIIVNEDCILMDFITSKIFLILTNDNNRYAFIIHDIAY